MNFLKVLFLGVAFLFISCVSDSDSESEGTNSETQGPNSESGIVGKWSLTVSENEEGEATTFKMTFSFTAENTYTLEQALTEPEPYGLGAESGTYVKTDTSLQLLCELEYRNSLADERSRACEKDHDMTYYFEGSTLVLVDTFEDEGEMLSDTLKLTKE